VQEETSLVAGLHTTAVGLPTKGGTVVVLLHGYDMRPADLIPFAHSINVPAAFLVPRGRISRPSGNYAWWEIDTEARSRALANGPRDLAQEKPAGLPAARVQLNSFLAAVRSEYRPNKLVLGGFSQGGMLACDWLLHTTDLIDGLVLLSASRLNFDNWLPLQSRLDQVPVFASHGQKDADLAFSAGERLMAFLVSAGAEVTWIPFEGGHEIPFLVWRELRRFLRNIARH
jgi:phospholipase/carboxylesterase